MDYEPSGDYWHNGATAGYYERRELSSQGRLRRGGAFRTLRPACSASFLRDNLANTSARGWWPACDFAGKSGGHPAEAAARISFDRLAAYWIAMLAAGVFIFCFVLSIQGSRNCCRGRSSCACRRSCRSAFLRCSWAYIFCSCRSSLPRISPGSRIRQVAVLVALVLVLRLVPAVERTATRRKLRCSRDRAWIGLAASLRRRHRGVSDLLFPDAAQDRGAARHLARPPVCAGCHVSAPRCRPRWCNSASARCCAAASIA